MWFWGWRCSAEWGNQCLGPETQFVPNFFPSLQLPSNPDRQQLISSPPQQLPERSLENVSDHICPLLSLLPVALGIKSDILTMIGTVSTRPDLSPSLTHSFSSGHT